MGWERFISPYQSEPLSDFEVHRAQMRHYDAFMTAREPGGALSNVYYSGPADSNYNTPETRAANAAMQRAVSAQLQSGGALAPGATGAGANGSPNNRAAPSVAQTNDFYGKIGGGYLSFRSSKLPDIEDAEGDLANIRLTAVMEPENTTFKTGFTWYSHPDYSDIELGAEAGFGDIGALPFAVNKYAAEIPFNLWMHWGPVNADGTKTPYGLGPDAVVYPEIAHQRFMPQNPTVPQNANPQYGPYIEGFESLSFMPPPTW